MKKLTQFLLGWLGAYFALAFVLFFIFEDRIANGKAMTLLLLAAYMIAMKIYEEDENEKKNDN